MASPKIEAIVSIVRTVLRYRYGAGPVTDWQVRIVLEDSRGLIEPTSDEREAARKALFRQYNIGD